MFTTHDLSTLDEDAFKRRGVLFFSGFLSIFAPIYAPVMLWMTGTWAPFISTLVCGALVFSSLEMLRRGFTYSFLGNWLAFNIFWLMVYLPFYAGVSNAPLLWISLVPMIAVVIAGTRSGLFWLVPSTCAVMIYFGSLARGHDFGVLLSPSQELLFMGAVLVGLSIVACIFTLLFNSALRQRLFQIRANEERIAALLDTVAEGILMTDGRGTIEVANPAACALFHRDQEQLIGLNIGTLLSLGHAEGVEPMVLDASLGVDREGLGRTKGGAYFPVEISLAMVQSESEQDRFVVTVRDVTERKQAEEAIHTARDQALKANKAKSTFLANMSHELRTPLNAIIGYSELVCEDMEDSGALEEDQTYKDLRAIRASADHLLGLINDILDLSKIEAGRMELFLERFSLELLIEQIVATSSPLVEAGGNAFRLDTEGAPEWVMGDRMKIKQILLNLLSTASKFTKGGVVRMNIMQLERPEGPVVCFEVQDTGKGIAPDRLDKLFEPFVQEDNSTQREYGGTGLGLTLSRHFAHMMGGEISAASVLAHGSTFKLTLPLEHAQASVQEPADVSLEIDAIARELEPRSEVVVLVIDDDPDVHGLMRRFLTDQDVVVLSALNGEHGLKLARAIKPVLIVLDVMMPGMDGWQVLSQLKSDDDLSGIPVVMASIVNERNMGFTLGAVEYLVKPIDRDRLYTILEGLGDPGASPHVLVVEDDESTRDVMERTVAQSGWRVAAVADGVDALAYLDTSTPDLVILDLMMPRLDGFGVLEHMRAKDNLRDIPFIVLTAMELSEAEREQLTQRAVE
ncbi:MAG: response regulator, partial [Myxococcota bacterium]